MKLLHKSILVILTVTLLVLLICYDIHKTRTNQIENFQSDLKQISNDNSFKFAEDKRLKMILKSYLKFKKLDSNWNYINSCSNFNLINQLSMICPFTVHEKQMLLESMSIDERYILLVSILQNTVNPNEKQNQIKH